MQPKMCTKCKKNIAVVFITKMENGVTLNEGYCLRCARGLGIPQIDQAVRQMGISEAVNMAWLKNRSERKGEE